MIPILLYWGVEGSFPLTSSGGSLTLALILVTPVPVPSPTPSPLQTSLSLLVSHCVFLGLLCGSQSSRSVCSLVHGVILVISYIVIFLPLIVAVMRCEQ